MASYRSDDSDAEGRTGNDRDTAAGIGRFGPADESAVASLKRQTGSQPENFNPVSPQPAAGMAARKSAGSWGARNPPRRTTPQSRLNAVNCGLS